LGQQSTLEFHYKKGYNNVGDMYCNPSRYFDFDNISSHCITKANSINLENRNIIVGGGGLIRRYFVKHTDLVSSSNYKNLIIWGIGHNFGWKENMWWPEWMTNSSLWGIRDYIKGYENNYVPCVSCMHPAFDKSYKIKYDHGYFLHHFSSKYKPQENDIVMYNDNTNFDEVIEFIGSCKTLITDSYHGAYWGLLLGKDVRVVSWTTKFNNFKTKPVILDKIENWRKHKPIVPWPKYLKDCRTLNINFYKKVQNLLSTS